MENSELIPFGKYRGRPIEDLASDPQYMEWLIQQPWFAQRHTNLYQIVINNFQEPSETPEHNAMQAKFLDENWRKKFLEAAGIKRFYKWGEFNPTVKFEINGIDVAMFDGYHIDENSICIELKPSIGDDYPAVLRTMLSGMKKKSSHCFLIVTQFSSQAVAEEQFRAIFKASGIRVIFSHEIEAAEIQPAPEIQIQIPATVPKLSDLATPAIDPLWKPNFERFELILADLPVLLRTNMKVAKMRMVASDSMLQVEFEKKHNLAKQYCERPDNINIINKSASKFFGNPVCAIFTTKCGE